MPICPATAGARHASEKIPARHGKNFAGPGQRGGAAAPGAERDWSTARPAIMGRIQRGRRYTADETAKIVAFLKTLTGGQPVFSMPLLPPSSDTTPRPEPFRP